MRDDPSISRGSYRITTQQVRLGTNLPLQREDTSGPVLSSSRAPQDTANGFEFRTTFSSVDNDLTADGRHDPVPEIADPLTRFLASPELWFSLSTLSLNALTVSPGDLVFCRLKKFMRAGGGEWVRR